MVIGEMLLLLNNPETDSHCWGEMSAASEPAAAPTLIGTRSTASSAGSVLDLQ